MPSDVGPGGFKPAYARAPFIFALARAQALPGPILIDLMTDLEGTSSSNKALLHRMTTGGALEVSRVGRVGIYRMAGRLLAGFTAVRGDGPLRSGAWDGRFHALIYDIPESRRRERDPAGVHLDDIRLAWPEVRSETTSSSVFLNPIKFPASALTAARRVASMEAMFPLHGTELVASGAAAVTAFAEHPEAADDDERFGPIADLLAARSIRHQLFFSGSAAYFSNQVLVLIDEHGQAWALQRHSNE